MLYKQEIFKGIWEGLGKRFLNEQAAYVGEADISLRPFRN